MKKRLHFLVVSALVLAVILALGAVDIATATDPAPGPILIFGDNPSCADLNKDNAKFPSITSNFGFKLEGAPVGTWQLVNLSDYAGIKNELTGSAPSDPYNSVTISGVDTGKMYFDWVATLGIDAVIVKGGNGANAYVYIPEAMGDFSLHAPENASGNFAAISHIEFCYDYELTVTKTAKTTYTRTWPWDIAKSVTPDTWDLFKGDSGTSDYVVEVTKGEPTDSAWAVSGEITIHNRTPLTATVKGVTDVISGGITPTLNCGVTFPHTLTANGKLVCTYSADLPDASARTNTATVTTSGDVPGGEAQAAVKFGEPTTKVNDEITVTDTLKGDLGKTSQSKKFEYSRTFTCNDDAGKYNNTASIVGTKYEASASVEVSCYDLTVEKDAATSFTRTWGWTIDKSADQEALKLASGQLFDVNYAVKVDAEKVDSKHAVTGTITITNPAPIPARLVTVTDVVSIDIAAEVACPVTFSYELAAGGTLVCTYSADLPGAETRINTATATLQNFAYNSAKVATSGGTTAFTGTAGVDFALAEVTEIDECVDVTDTNLGKLGTVCAGNAPITFFYPLSFGQHPDADVQLVCGANTHTNTAAFTTNDNGFEDSDSWTVNATVACATGCTLTQGYWKTHSEKGPAPYDDNWAQLPDGADTLFYTSGMSWYEVLWTPPKGGNPYYILAHQFIAAKLNFLNGAGATPEVDAALVWAEDFFKTNTPTTKFSKSLGNEAKMKASLLDQYNMGLVGPGHCSETNPESGGASLYALWETQLFLPAIRR